MATGFDTGLLSSLDSRLSKFSKIARNDVLQHYRIAEWQTRRSFLARRVPLAAASEPWGKLNSNSHSPRRVAHDSWQPAAACGTAGINSEPQRTQGAQSYPNRTAIKTALQGRHTIAQGVSPGFEDATDPLSPERAIYEWRLKTSEAFKRRDCP